jgi:O-antigen/teichoic acid export membrane protein
VVTRWLVLAAHAWLCRSSLRLALSSVSREWVAPLLRFGGWLTASNIVGPVIVYLDRFIVGFALPPSHLAYYAAPFDLVSRLLVFPVSLTGALFPALAQAQTHDAAKARALRRRSMQLTAVAVLPLALFGAIAAEPLLQWWLGDEFARHGTLPMQILLVGFAFNALAQIPMVALQGHGLAKQAALLHLIELPLYAAGLYALVQSQGLVGAALAWTLRGAFDMIVLGALLRRAER